MTMPEPTPAPPSATPTLRQTVPADLPFAVQPSGAWRHIISHRRGELVVLVLLALFMLPAGVYMLLHSGETVHSNRYGNMNSGLLGGGALLLVAGLGVSLPITAARQLRQVPLAADAHGVYVRPNLDPKRVLHLPWEHIESIYVRNWHGPQLCVKPRDARIEPQFNLAKQGDASARAGVAVAQKRRMKKLGTNVHVPIATAGQTPDELLAGLRYQAAGRVPVGS
ncbi:hypothetical protein ACFQY4_03820 [Catellatospora bangladeshensis]|uniref:PH domain-containing protein n=1 Tax=Catellatospora bangladeshensis TaxID=310355 RepID=A0A8J3JAR3_9ACTN|nr:hypothetical protein [Catellatospora bangladeshensis]GIF79259.1 hypothetical protein Cba03nite_06080 [Catellatospora bangladeshensis]